MYVNTPAEVKAETDYCVTSSNAVAVVEHIYREHGEDTEILFGPDMFLGAFVEKRTGRADAGVGRRVPRPRRHPPARHRRRCAPRTRAPIPHPPRVRLLDVGHGVRGRRRRRPEGVHMLSTGGMLAYAEHAAPGGDGDRGHRGGDAPRLRMAAPDVDFIAANEAASCRYMKMITLRSSATRCATASRRCGCRPAIAERARAAIERMVAIG